MIRGRRRLKKKLRQNVELMTPHAGQVAIYNAALPFRYNAICCGRRFGKTAMITTMAISTAMKQIAHPETGVKTPGRVGIFTPEHRQWSEIYKEIISTLANTGLIESASKNSKEITLTTGGVIDFWATNDNPLAGRGRKYHLALIDEAAFTKDTEFLQETWPRAIEPTLLDYLGHCWAFSTPDGVNEENFFWWICNDPRSDFVMHYAPSRSNPYMSVKELYALKQRVDPLVWRQEYLAKFVDWSGQAFFNIRTMMLTKRQLKPGEAFPKDESIESYEPYPNPWDAHQPQDAKRRITCAVIYAVIDTTMKGGLKNDGTAVAYWGVTAGSGRHNQGATCSLLDWDYFDVTSDMLGEKLSEVVAQLNYLHKACKVKSPIEKAKIFVEDAAYGHVLVNAGKANGWPVQLLEKEYSMLGKDDCALAVSVPLHARRVKISEHAYNKTVLYKNQTARHMVNQLVAYKIRDPKAGTRADDLVDAFMYGIMLSGVINSNDLHQLAKGALQRKQAAIENLAARLAA